MSGGMSPDSARRIADLDQERRRISQDHERLTARLIGAIAETDREVGLDNITDDEIRDLVNGVRQIAKHRDRRREIKNAITALVS